ncbi:D-hexose-6-phosphate mutarotase [Timonella senegalensis]|uniref:D-hexose-6-phosphate mutarotase n=1 Tax=Timonella senegalensis TaxID=1465825 RepID=UPI0028A65708|nr:D-hexose-6-phosphate mutarotase [Timonella senegalensis]
MTGTDTDQIQRVVSPSGVFAVHSAGAHVTQWETPEHGPLIFVSEKSGYGLGTPIRGGIPLCFPWFGAGASGGKSPKHGFARLVNWRLVSESENSIGDWTVSFALSNEDLSNEDLSAKDPRTALFPHPFEAAYTTTFTGTSLTASLEVTNRGTEPFTFEEALHTYFRVGDIRQTEITGLEGAAYLDKAASSPTAGDDPIYQEGPVTFSGEVDRVYSSRGTTTIIDKQNQRLIRIEKSHSKSTVVWNPWSELAKGMSDLGDDEWTQFVCVESANAGDSAVTLSPGATHTLRVTYTVTSA